jgi:two-component system, LytTR family, sensor histidine kinase AlgZ
MSMDRNKSEFFIPDICAPQPTLFMILLMELLVLAYVLASSPLPQFDWELFAIASLFAQWLLMLSAWLLCRFRGSLSTLSLTMATICSLALVSLTTLLSSLFVQFYLPVIVGSTNNLWWTLRNVLIANMLAGASLRYFYLQQQLRQRDQWTMQARLESLRAKIRPHFLFNTLNSIASLIAERPAAAERAVEDLSELFRASLKESYSLTTVQDEILLTERYLEIEKLRLGERLSVAWEVDEAIRSAPMPLLLLQPLAENAIYHGIAQIPAGGRIEITIGGSFGILHLRICNPLPREPTETKGNRMALTNVEQRLKAIYGPGAKVHSSRSPSGLFCVELSYRPPETVN